jgi:SAM-dependent methyltransferase
MGFDVSADAYDLFMGRYSEPLAVQFADAAGVRAGQRALDVGCGPGALTRQLVERLGVGGVAAVDPTGSFVAAARQRFPEVDVRPAFAEELPFADEAFDAALAQLVVPFMADPVAGLREMARVTRSGGVVAASVWRHAEATGPLSTFWAAVREVDPHAWDETAVAGTRPGHLTELFAAAGLPSTETTTLTVNVPFRSFDEWWEPYTLGVGPAGTYVARLDDEQRAALRERCARRLSSEPFAIQGSAWCVVAHV